MISLMDQQKIDSAADLLVRRRPAVFMTGAGVSVESGIADFRSAGGLWDKFDPMEYASIQAFKANPRKVWNMLRELEHTLTEAAPNAGHRALAELEELGVVNGVITQNIDNLHQEAGSSRVIEFHGNGRRLVCLACRHRIDASMVRRDGNGSSEPPTCPECGEILKPDVIFFGEKIPDVALTDSFELAASCEVMVIGGTSATVMPANQLPLMARQNGATLIEINLESTELTSEVDLTLRGHWGQVMPVLVDAVKTRLASR